MTIIFQLTHLLTPDYCCNCRKIGQIMCQSCINDIISEPFGRCVACLSPSLSSQLCNACRAFADNAWVVGERSGALERLVNASKFESNRRGCTTQAHLLNRTLPDLPSSTIIAPVPTITPHIRKRGYGHMEVVASELARLRGYEASALLRRNTATVQHGADKIVRRRQAESAFSLATVSDLKRPILVIDDVYTTGATLKAAVSLLRECTKAPIFAAVTSRQLLD